MNHEGTKRQGEGLRLVAEEAERTAREIVDAALAVHKVLRPGLLESVHEACLQRELELNQIDCQSLVRIPLGYRGVELHDSFLRAFVPL